jgi:hypothetical protein
MSLHYLNGIITEKETIQAINKNAFNKGIKQLNKPEFKTPFTMSNYDVNDCLIYPKKETKKDNVNGLLDDAWNNIQGGVSDAWNNITSTVSTGVQNVLTTGGQALQTIQTQGQTALQNVTSTIQQGVQSIQVPPFFTQNLNEMWNDIIGNVGKYGKKIALQPLRTAFLVVVSANVFKLGTKLANAWNKDKNRITNWWANDWGGDINILKQAINRSSNIALNGNYKNNYLGEVTTAVVLAEITKATAVITSIAGVLKSLGVSIQDIQDGVKGIVPPKKAPSVTATSPQVETLPPANETYPEITTTKDSTMLYVGLGGALLVGGYLLMKKKK